MSIEKRQVNDDFCDIIISTANNLTLTETER